MQGVERPRAGQFGDVRRGLTGHGVELDDPERGDVLEEGRLGGSGVALAEQSREVATNLDDRVPRGQQRRVAHEQRVGRGGVRLVDIALEESARIDVEAHGPRSSERTSRTLLARRPARCLAKSLPRSRRDPSLGHALLDPCSARQRPEHGFRPSAVGDAQHLAALGTVEVLRQPLLQLAHSDVRHVGTLADACVYKMGYILGAVIERYTRLVARVRASRSHRLSLVRGRR